jgi:hypothetical protein
MSIPLKRNIITLNFSNLCLKVLQNKEMFQIKQQKISQHTCPYTAGAAFGTIIKSGQFTNPTSVYRFCSVGSLVVVFLLLISTNDIIFKFTVGQNRHEK